MTLSQFETPLAATTKSDGELIWIYAIDMVTLVTPVVRQADKLQDIAWSLLRPDLLAQGQGVFWTLASPKFDIFDGLLHWGWASDFCQFKVSDFPFMARSLDSDFWLHS